MERIEKYYKVMSFLKESFELIDSMPNVHCAYVYKDDIKDLNSRDIRLSIYYLHRERKYISATGSDKDGYWRVTKEESFDEGYKIIQNEYNQLLENLEVKGFVYGLEEDAVLRMSMNANGVIYINNKRFKKTNHNSVNRRVLGYLLKNPRQIISREDFEKAGVLSKKDDKDFTIVLDDLGMKGDWKKLFFPMECSKHTLYLRNPIRKFELENENITEEDLDRLFSSLEK